MFFENLENADELTPEQIAEQLKKDLRKEIFSKVVAAIHAAKNDNKKNTVVYVRLYLEEKRELIGKKYRVERDIDFYATSADLKFFTTISWD
jgi:hypothetical protein